MEVVDLALHVLVLTPQLLVAASQAFVLILQVRAVALAPRPLPAPPFSSERGFVFLTVVPRGARRATGTMPNCERLYKCQLIVRLHAQCANPVNEYHFTWLATGPVPSSAASSTCSLP